MGWPSGEIRNFSKFQEMSSRSKQVKKKWSKELLGTVSVKNHVWFTTVLLKPESKESLWKYKVFENFLRNNNDDIFKGYHRESDHTPIFKC